MIYGLAAVIAFIQIAWGAELNVFGGIGYYLPGLIIIAASSGRPRLYGIGWAALAFTAFFQPLSPATIALTFIISVLTYLLLERWINYDNPFIVGLVASIAIALMIIGDRYWFTHMISLRSFMGSLILTLPVVIICLTATKRVRPRSI